MLYLVRHGQTLWNTEARFQGQFDSPLTELGRDQATRIGRALAAEIGMRAEPIRAYVSPLGRTRVTAALIGQSLPMRVVEEPRLMEVHFGDWEGLTREDILSRLAAINPFDRSTGNSRRRAAKRWTSCLPASVPGMRPWRLRPSS